MLPVIVPNHKSFWDAFFVAACLTRRVHFMGKAELFEGRKGRLLLALGGFPVKRGESDAEALDTARAVLARGDILALFPEGTRVRDPEALGTPKRGAARLAIEAGAPADPDRHHRNREAEVAAAPPRAGGVRGTCTRRPAAAPPRRTPAR